MTVMAAVTAGNSNRVAVVVADSGGDSGDDSGDSGNLGLTVVAVVTVQW
jgi:hypothetical protein